MKKIVLVIALFAMSVSLFAGNDILTLNNKKAFKGEVTRVTNNIVVFKAGGERYKVPSSEVYTIEFSNAESRAYKKYLKWANSSSSNCEKGKADAKAFHGKKGGHFVLGFLFGPFAMLGTLASNPTPQRGKSTFMSSENKQLFTDPEYLNCYRKTAKKQLIGMEALGWGAWIVIVLATM